MRDPDIPPERSCCPDRKRVPCALQAPHTVARVARWCTPTLSCAAAPQQPAQDQHQHQHRRHYHHQDRGLESIQELPGTAIPQPQGVHMGGIQGTRAHCASQSPQAGRRIPLCALEDARRMPCAGRVCPQHTSLALRTAGRASSGTAAPVHDTRMKSVSSPPCVSQAPARHKLRKSQTARGHASQVAARHREPATRCLALQGSGGVGIGRVPGTACYAG